MARRLSLGSLPAPVVAGSRSRVGVTGELLGRGEVTYGIQQVADEGLAEVVGESFLTPAASFSPRRRWPGRSSEPEFSRRRDLRARG